MTGRERAVRLWRWWRSNPVHGDATLALALSALTLLASAEVTTSLEGHTLAWGLLLGAGFTLPLVWRRTHPEPTALVVAATHLAQVVTVSSPLPGNITAPIMLYTVVRYGRPRDHQRWLLLALVGGLAGALRWGWYVSPLATVSPWQQRAFLITLYLVFNSSVVAAAWFMAQWGRQRQMTLDSLRQRAEAVEREHDKAVALAAEEERNRIAREMHDIVAHSLSVVVVQADGARYLAGHDELGDPEARLAQVLKALDTIRETAGTALGETRRLVGVLRQQGEAAELAPAATLDQVAELVHTLDATGIPATFERTGDPAAHPPFSPGAQMALYRVAQESLTNVMKHAGPRASVTVRLHEDADGLELHVADTGLGATPTDGAGHGVVGMRERMTAWGGTLVAGPRAGGGFEVVARMPARQEGSR